MIKKFILATALFTTSAIASFAQFSDKGYKDIKLGMPVKDVRTILGNFALDADNFSKIKIDGIEFGASFTDFDGQLVLWSLTATNPKAKVVGVLSELIGKNLAQVKTIVGTKLVRLDLDESPQNNYFAYYATPDSRNNEETSCIFYFNDKGILESISAAYNP